MTSPTTLRPAAIASLIALSLFAPSLPACADAVISTEVNSPVVMPGIDYVMNVKADNTGLNGQETRAVEWMVSINPIETYINVTEAKLPTQSDFFYGKEMDITYNNVKLPEVLSGRKVKMGETGVVNGSGILGEYTFNINGYTGDYTTASNPVETQFWLGFTSFVGPGGVSQPHTVTNVPFAIARPGDSNLDGIVNVGDLAILASKWQQPADWYGADYNNDGIVNVGDLAVLAANWQSNYSAGGAGAVGEVQGSYVPEPGLVSLLGAGGAAVLARRRSRP